jgi:uncharacterized protein YndB with AHSA1/START domain
MQTVEAQVLEGSARTAGEHELRLERLLDAPREMVWEAWTRREHLSRWCAPHGFAVTHSEGTAREGKAWRSCMKSPDGEEHWLGGVYHEVSPVERLVFTHVWDGEGGQPGHETLVTVTLADEGSRTRLVLKQEFLASASSRDGHESGWSESLQRLSTWLEKMEESMSTNGNRNGNGARRALAVEARGEMEIVMTRAFEAPRELVWEALSKPEHIRRWWGSCGDGMTVCEMDFRVGGAWRFVVSGPQGEDGFRGHYREISPVGRLVQTFEWEGMPGHISTETMTLDERGSQTHMTITCVFATPEDRDGMLASGMEQGVSESYDKLEELLREMSAAVA